MSPRERSFRVELPQPVRLGRSFWQLVLMLGWLGLVATGLFHALTGGLGIPRVGPYALTDWRTPLELTLALVKGLSVAAIAAAILGIAVAPDDSRAFGRPGPSAQPRA